MPKRRIAIGAAIASTVAVLLGALAWLWWIPSAVRERVSEAAARRGLEATVAGVEPSFGGVTLRGLRLSGGEGALVVDVGEVDTGAGIFALAIDGTAAIRRLRLRDVRLSADLDDDGLGPALEALRPGPVEDGDAPSTDGRALEVEGLEVVLRDRDGTVASLEGGRLNALPEGIVRVTTGSIEIAPGEADGLVIGRSSLRGERGEDGWKLAGAELADAEVRYEEREGQGRSPLWPRIRRHVRWASDTFIGDADSGSTDGDGRSEERAPHPIDLADRPTEDGEERQPAGGDRRPTSASADGDEGPESESLGLDPDAPGSADRVVLDPDGSTSAMLVRALEAMGPRLSSNATLRLEDLSVMVRSAEGERPVLRDLEAEVRAISGGRYRLEGSGRPGRGGRLGWDLTVDPTQLRAEGRLDFQRLPFVLLVPILPGLPWHHPENTRLSGDLTIRQDEGGARTHLEGEVSVEDLALSSPRIAPEPVQRIALFMSGEADWVPLERRLEIGRMQVGVGRARIDVTGSLEWPADHYLLDVRATLPPTDCNVAIAAIPADLLADATAFTFTGQIGGRVVARIDSRQLDDTRLEIGVANGCVFETAPGMADVTRFDGPFTHRVVEPDGTTFEMETGPGTLAWTPLSQISPFFVHAVLGHEDAGFFHHSGFSESSIRLALVRNLRAGRYVYGASTITMQLVKNVFLHREKTLARKVQEVILTWWLESVMDKTRILELYLNVIEYGPQVYGIRSAAMHYFGRTPAQLGPAESAYLATILPNPKAFHSHWAEDALPERHRRRVARFLHTLQSRDRYDAEAVAYALAELERFEFHQPHEPLPADREIPGGAAPLPFGADLDAAWDEVIGTDGAATEIDDSSEDDGV